MIIECIVVLLVIFLVLNKFYNTSDFGDSVSPEEEREVQRHGY